MPTFGTVDTQTELTGGGTLIINGTRPPTDTDGAVGDYWLDTAGKTLYGPKGSSPVYGPEQYPVSVTPAATTSSANTTGLKFRALVSGRVTGVRYWRVNFISSYSLTLLLYLQSTQAELARATVSVPSNTTAGWIVVPFATPVNVAAGTDYRVAAMGNIGRYGNSGVLSPVSAIPTSITLNGPCQGTGLSYPGTDATEYWFIDIAFQAASSWPIAIKSAP